MNCGGLLKTASNDRDAEIVHLLLDSGIRASELINITPADVQDDRIRVFGKGSKERIVFASGETRLLISMYYLTRPDPVDDNRLFLTRDGRQLSPDRLQKILVYLGKRAGIRTWLAAHKMRHTYATLSFLTM